MAYFLTFENFNGIVIGEYTSPIDPLKTDPQIYKGAL